MTGPRTTFEDSATVVRWAVFCCVLVPVVLLWYGTSLAGATGTALGLAAVTAVCRVLLRESERGAARMRDDAARMKDEERAGPVPSRRGRHHRTGTGAHRGGRHSGGNTPVG
ncbi:hypothetical protein SAMN04487981_110130 [Streptomyces sp. cf386]|uniref:hypothetical protein n=1 Tax=Streptomyces sp. cf386 TaxID=1761904 RepID=UPI000890339B|nr:hypothetical protein [Streptomyces sp. cf386]SDO36646.1 hypothetical protein SAMN04487981_110130 [Streptomyces sp. cf386]